MRLKLTVLPHTPVARVAVALLVLCAIAIGLAHVFKPALLAAVLLSFPLGPIALLLAKPLVALHGSVFDLAGLAVVLVGFFANFYFLAWVWLRMRRSKPSPPAVSASPGSPSPTAAPSQPQSQHDGTEGHSNANNRAA